MSERHHSMPRRLFAALAASAIAVSACGGSATPAPSGAPASSAASNIPMGGSISMRLGADISSWDPCVIQAATVPGTMGDVLNAVYGALVYTDVDGIVQPSMAESLTTKDAITWTFKLRDRRQVHRRHRVRRRGREVQLRPRRRSGQRLHEPEVDRHLEVDQGR